MITDEMVKGALRAWDDLWINEPRCDIRTAMRAALEAADKARWRPISEVEQEKPTDNVS